MRRVTVLAVATALVAACAGGAEPSTTTSEATSTSPNAPAATTTTAQASTTTTSSPLPGPTTAEGLSYFRFGPDGLYRVEGHDVEQLVSEPVWWALDDLMGGVLFRYGPPPATDAYPPVELEPGVYWLRAGERFPMLYPHDHDYWEPWFTGVVDGRATVFFAGHPTDTDFETMDCEDWALCGHDLLDGYEREHVCLPVEDAGLGIGSVGDNVFVGDIWWAAGVMTTSDEIAGWNVHGEPVDLPGNPFETSCVPCLLSALISLDGRYLAYSHWPEAPWSPEPGKWIESEEDWDAWREEARETPVHLGVVDLLTGQEVWSDQRPAGSHLFDFDGRHLVLHEVVPDPTHGGSELTRMTIIDTWGRHQPLIMEPDVGLVLIQPAGLVPGVDEPFWTVVVASLGTDTIDLGRAFERVDAMEVATGRRPWVLLSDDFASLNPGYWVLYDGVFSTAEEASAHAERLSGASISGYVRWVESDPTRP